MNGRLVMGMVVAASGLWLSACGSDSEATENANRGAGGSRAPAEPTCPDPRPMDGAMCGNRGLTCAYDEGDCTCSTDTMAAFGTLAWDCPIDFRAQMCPMDAPEPGTECTTVFGECDYGEDNVCDCVDEMRTWSCWNPANCPMTPPENQSACDPVGMECEYDDMMLECECTGEGWFCAEDPF